MAAEEGALEVVKVLLRDPAVQARVNDRDIQGRTPLMLACAYPRIIDLLLLANASVEEAKLADGVTVLMLACRDGHSGSAIALMKADADPDEQDDRGRTALMAAAEYGHMETVLALMERGATVNISTASHSGCTREKCALFCAVEYRHTDVVKLLIENGATLDVASLNPTDKAWYEEVVNSMNQIVMLDRGSGLDLV